MYYLKNENKNIIIAKNKTMRVKKYVRKYFIYKIQLTVNNYMLNYLNSIHMNMNLFNNNNNQNINLQI